MPNLNPEHIQTVIGAINNCPFFKLVSMQVAEIGPGYSMVTAKIGKKHMNPFGGLHGGVYASVIDTAAYWAAYCDISENSGLVSIDLKIDLLAPVIDGTVIVKGRRIKSGKTIHLAEAEMCDNDGKLLAHGISKLMVTHGKQSINDVAQYIGLEGMPDKFIKN